MITVGVTQYDADIDLDKAKLDCITFTSFSILSIFMTIFIKYIEADHDVSAILVGIMISVIITTVIDIIEEIQEDIKSTIKTI